MEKTTTLDVGGIVLTASYDSSNNLYVTTHDNIADLIGDSNRNILTDRLNKCLLEDFRASKEFCYAPEFEEITSIEAQGWIYKDDFFIYLYEKTGEFVVTDYNNESVFNSLEAAEAHLYKMWRNQ